MKKQRLSKKIMHAVEERYPLYWVRKGLRGLELRAISYTYEHGSSRTVKLAEFDLKLSLGDALRAHFEVCKLVDASLAPDIMPSLDNAFWQGELQFAPNKIIEEFHAQAKAGLV